MNSRLPAAGAPATDASPLTNVKNPNAAVRRSKPMMSHRMIDVREMYVATVKKTKVTSLNVM